MNTAIQTILSSRAGVFIYGNPMIACEPDTVMPIILNEWRLHDPDAISRIPAAKRKQAARAVYEYAGLGDTRHRNWWHF